MATYRSDDLTYIPHGFTMYGTCYAGRSQRHAIICYCIILMINLPFWCNIIGVLDLSQYIGTRYNEGRLNILFLKRGYSSTVTVFITSCL